ncbi:MAG: transcriptional regulator [Flavobacteriales bacterium]|nr:transcriptional regulator [Flavobacteriales bacterium]
MDLDEAKYKFIQEWGVLGSSWGINRAMAQIHACLLLSPDSKTTDEVMEELKISRGNANMNMRALIDWGLVFKEFKPGERKEYFYAEKDLWTVMKQIAKERRKREIIPIRDVLAEVSTAQVGDSAEGKEFKKVTKDIDSIISKFDGLIEMASKSDKNWFLKILSKLVT